ncbi:hypothetical protein BT93_L1067 [Corymbia citriodora subsp. variegata]|uniref:Cysteine-rich receptor-like protein kinase 10 n=1 Tax=Corymbia citriodora subsp. variegata TaxID=360336 RepID=A0A8T0CPV3_CORYI|nr:hypothetical protein BT93_L1067 [Corymbia citriodora subsp. variegata]
MDPPIIPLLLLLTIASTINAQFFPNPYCGSTGNFTADSTYQTTLTTLLASISTANSLSLTYGFFSASAAVSGASQTLYVIGSCRGDLTAESCRTCLDASASDIRSLCPLQKEAVLYSENCTVRYSNTSIFSTVATEPVYILYNVNNVSTQVTFMLGTLMDGLRSKAASRGSLRKFATGNGSVGFDMIYLMAQCTPDLTEEQCIECQEKIVGSVTDCCLGKAGMRALAPSCQFRYETNDRFFDPVAEPLPPPPPPSPPPPLPPPPPPGKSNKSTVITIAITVPLGGVMVLVLLTCCLLRRKRKKTYEDVKEKCATNELTTVESLQFDLATIQVATNDFSPENKLGEGGFGEVFQGRLLDGQQIAVKRLSQSSRQGGEEFKNEVLLVAKLQHRNLVRLLGFCLEGDEKLLIYEFVPNKSLDYFLFDPQKGSQLNWPLRYKIVSGIARGMLYLHEDSRLRIIHRDLKCSNILLDSEMNPKVSDFGMARIFGVNQTQANTNKIVGTLNAANARFCSGYMSPEYAMHGEFSVKSDVYSFGILLIEIICGKKNNFYHQLHGGEYLASYVWNQWKEGMALKVLDSTIVDSYSRDEVLRCLHIGLLCIQEDPAIRPTMATVVLMLSSSYFNPPSPRHPAFFVRSRSRGLSIPMKELESDQSTSQTMPSSISDMSITELYSR